MIRSIILCCTAFAIAALGYLNSIWFEEPVDTGPIEPNSNSSQQVSETLNTAVEFELDDVLQTNRVQTFSRPLFNETRRKVLPAKQKKKQVIKKIETESALSEEVVADLPNILLVGISIQPEKSIALIIDQDSNASNWFGINGVVQDWRISRIESQYILLSSATETIKFSLYEELLTADGENE